MLNCPNDSTVQLNPTLAALSTCIQLYWQTSMQTFAHGALHISKTRWCISTMSSISYRVFSLNWPLLLFICKNMFLQK